MTQTNRPGADETITGASAPGGFGPQFDAAARRPSCPGDRGAQKNEPQDVTPLPARGDESAATWSLPMGAPVATS
jgi:hypothetical protein